MWDVTARVWDMRAGPCEGRASLMFNTGEVGRGRASPVFNVGEVGEEMRNRV